MFFVLQQTISKMASCYTASYIKCTDSYDPHADVNAMYDDYNATYGLYSLVINVSQSLSNSQQAFAAGYIEGLLTAELIGDYFVNSKLPNNFVNFTQQQYNYLLTIINSPNIAIAHQLNISVSHIMGMQEGCNSKLQSSYSFFDFLALNQLNLLPTWRKKKNILSNKYRVDTENISAIIQRQSSLLFFDADKFDIFAGQTNNQNYSNSFLRIQKTYNLNYIFENLDHRQITFTSYPGVIYSPDGFYDIIVRNYQSQTNFFNLMKSRFPVFNQDLNIFNVSFIPECIIEYIAAISSYDLNTFKDFLMGTQDVQPFNFVSYTITQYNFLIKVRNQCLFATNKSECATDFVDKNSIKFMGQVDVVGHTSQYLDISAQFMKMGYFFNINLPHDKTSQEKLHINENSTLYGPLQVREGLVAAQMKTLKSFTEFQEALKKSDPLEPVHGVAMRLDLSEEPIDDFSGEFVSVDSKASSFASLIKNQMSFSVGVSTDKGVVAEFNSENFSDIGVAKKLPHIYYDGSGCVTGNFLPDCATCVVGFEVKDQCLQCIFGYKFKNDVCVATSAAVLEGVLWTFLGLTVALVGLAGVKYVMIKAHERVDLVDLQTVENE